MAEGPNLVTNGDVPVDVSGWTVEVTGAGSFAWETPGQGKLSGATNPVSSPGVTVLVYQSITVTATTDYKSVFDIKSSVNSSYSKQVGVGTTKDNFSHGSSNADTTGNKTLLFTTGAETTVYVSMKLSYADFSFSSSGNFAVDDITLKEQLDAAFLPMINVV
jgi:hypothetical protein